MNTISGRKTSTLHTCPNLVIKKIIITMKLIMAPSKLTVNFSSQPFGFSLIHFINIPVWASVKGINTPTAYSGISCSVCPLKIMISPIEVTARKMIPFEYPSRSPRIVNIRAINLSFAKFTANKGNAEYPVFAARTRIMAVVPWTI
ncbi:hypothetical protein D3C85_1127160 [compost metagenome]